MIPSCALLLIAATQDLGTEWIDRVERELRWDRAALESRPPSFSVSAGVVGYYDSNVFLEERDERADFVLIPYVRGRFDYEEPTFDFAADLTLGYKHFFREDRARDDDQRLFLRASTTQPGFGIEIAEILRHESEPVDIVFLERAERVVSDTLVRGTVDLSEILAFEAAADLEIVRYLESPFDRLRSNFNYRVSGAIVLRLVHEMELLLQGGYLAIAYRADPEEGAPPDGRGHFFRAGFRGELTSHLTLEAWAGYTEAGSDDTGTADLALHLRYEATELWTITFDYTRRFEFAGGPDAFEVVSRVRVGLEVRATEELTLHSRIQWDQISLTRGEGRSYGSASLFANYRLSEHVVIDGGATYRAGELDSGGEFDGFLFHLGVGIAF